jgi:predicted kinase
MHKDELSEVFAGMEEPFVVMSVGAPGSGKTTVLEGLSEKTGVARISPDEIRAELTGSEINQSQNEKVWAEVYNRVRQHLEQRLSVIVDATHAEAFRRPKVVKTYREMGATAVLALLFHPPLGTVQKRNRERERVVPGYAVARIHGAITKQPPSKKEGFDRVIRVDQTHNR